MKKIFLTIGMVIFSVSVFAQEATNSIAYIGWWFSEANERSNLFFWKDENSNLKLQEISRKGQGSIIRDYEVDTASVYMRSSPPRFPNKVTASSYYLVNKETIYCIALDEYTGKETNTYYKKYR